jgi:hypothetical protein
MINDKILSIILGGGQFLSDKKTGVTLRRS